MSLQGTNMEINGLKLNVLVEGKGEPVLLLHGFPDSNYLWRGVIPHLVKAGYRVIAPDQRGFGESEWQQD
jgi:pimeloyl-ACP methyl ester carboxylesterase